MLVDLADDRREIDAVARRLPFLGEQFLMDRVQARDPIAAFRRVLRHAALEQRLDDLVRARRDAEIGPPHATDLVRIRPDVHKRQLRLRRLREGVGLADGVGHALAERNHQIGLLHLADQGRRHADPHIAAVIRVRRVEELRPAVRRTDRQHPFLGEPIEVGEHAVVAQRIGP